MKIKILDSELWIKWMYIPNENQEKWEKYYDIPNKTKNLLADLYSSD
jgi:hypothetical protein